MGVTKSGFITFLTFLVVRVASVFIVKTFYVPDEYWQSLEVSHKLAFGYGYMTWEWVHGLRSYVYPALFAGVYKLLAFFEQDTVELLILIPRILQAIFSAYSDYRLYIWSGKKKWAAFLILVSYFWFYTASRTLVNTLETDLTAIALSYFPWNSESTAFLWTAAACCYLRPTAAIVWIVLCCFHLGKSRFTIFDILLKRYLFIGVVVFAVASQIDSYFYGKQILTPWEFLKYNVMHNIGTHYGTHPWYYYLAVGLPTILGITIIPFLVGAIQTVLYRKIYPERVVLLIAAAMYLAVLSCLSHKENRFLLILLPICTYISADVLSRWSYKARSVWLWLVAVLLIVGNAVPAYYFSVVHQKGTLEVMSFMSGVAKNYKDDDGHRASILFLMPCHSTPFYSHLHENVTMRFLTCEPNLNNMPQYSDEADKFYDSPETWVRKYLPSYPKSALPSHVIMFDILKSSLSVFLKDYAQMTTIAHTEYIYDKRVGKNVVVFERVRTPPPPPPAEKEDFLDSV